MGVLRGWCKKGGHSTLTQGSLIRAGAMMLEHIGFDELGQKLHKALDICGQYERKVVMTGRSTGTTSEAFGDYIMETVEDANVEARWEEYVNAEA